MISLMVSATQSSLKVTNSTNIKSCASTTLPTISSANKIQSTHELTLTSWSWRTRTQTTTTLILIGTLGSSRSYMSLYDILGMSQLIHMTIEWMCYPFIGLTSAWCWIEDDSSDALWASDLDIRDDPVMPCGQMIWVFDDPTCN
jgi:hypothetical protein